MTAAAAAPPRPGLAGNPVLDRAAEVAEVAAAHAERTDRDAAFPVEALAAMRSTGLLGALVPADLGGLGGGTRDLVDASMLLARTDMSVAMVFAMHCQQVAAVDAFAAPPLRRRLLGGVAAGDLYLASVTTEAGTGGHLLSAGTGLRAAGEGLDLDRFAPIVTGGAYADGFLVTMRSPAARGEAEVSLVYAERDQLDTVEVRGGWDPLGMRASHSVPMRLAGRIPGDQVVGRHGDFRTVVTRVFGPLAHLGWSACWLGTAAGALSRVLTLLRSRDGRARHDLDSELLLTRLSSARARLDTVHALLRHTDRTLATAADPSLPRVQLLLNALKITASEQCLAAVEDLVAALGMRHGYLRGSPTRLEVALRDLRSAPLNYSNDRLHLTDGRLGLLDPEVRLA